ncbi:unnamed protein product [Urochloa humidicola]
MRPAHARPADLAAARQVASEEERRHTWGKGRCSTARLGGGDICGTGETTSALSVVPVSPFSQQTWLHALRTDWEASPGALRQFSSTLGNALPHLEIW